MTPSFKQYLNKLDKEKRKLTIERIETFADPLAEKIQWNSISHFSSFFRTRILERKPDEKLVLTPTPSFILFCMLFIIIGLFALFSKPLFLWGLLFITSGSACLRVAIRPIEFNLQEQYYKKGFSAFNPHHVTFDSIHAIQILVRHSGGGDNGIDIINFEMNLVLKDTTRVNIITHANYKTIKEDAEQIAKALSIPVWDLTHLIS